MSKTYVQIMQAEIDALKAERDQARRWLQWVIDIARAGDAATLASTTDAADQWLHRDKLAAEYGPEVAACADALCKHAARWNLEDDGSLTCAECGVPVTLLDFVDPDTAAALRWAGAGAEEALKGDRQ